MKDDEPLLSLGSGADDPSCYFRLIGQVSSLEHGQPSIDTSTGDKEGDNNLVRSDRGTENKGTI